MERHVGAVIKEYRVWWTNDSASVVKFSMRKCTNNWISGGDAHLREVSNTRKGRGWRIQGWLISKAELKVQH